MAAALPGVRLQVLDGQVRDGGSLRGPLVPDEVLVGRAVNQVAWGEKEEHMSTREHATRKRCPVEEG